MVECAMGGLSNIGGGDLVTYGVLSNVWGGLSNLARLRINV